MLTRVVAHLIVVTQSVLVNAMLVGDACYTNAASVYSVAEIAGSLVCEVCLRIGALLE